LQIEEDADLALGLLPSNQREEGMLGIVADLREGFDLLLHEESRRRGQKICHAAVGGVTWAVPKNYFGGQLES